MLPFTVTVSISLQHFYISSDIIFLRDPEMSSTVPNCFVAASSLAAMLTFGER